MADLDAQQQAATGTDDEVVAAGFLPRAAGTRGNPGFESGGALDTCVPGGPLAGLADAATRDGRLSELDDDELIGVLRAWRRLESWCSSSTLAATAELARRRPADRTPPASATGFPAQLSEFIGDEVAAALTLTGRAADAHLELALDLALRLPATDRAHREGIIDYPKTRLIADLTRVLSDEHARQVEDKVLAAAGQQTTGQLRAARYWPSILRLRSGAVKRPNAIRGCAAGRRMPVPPRWPAMDSRPPTSCKPTSASPTARFAFVTPGCPAPWRNFAPAPTSTSCWGRTPRRPPVSAAPRARLSPPPRGGWPRVST
jgi:hypothetical protein